MDDIIERIGTLLTTRFGATPDEVSSDAGLGEDLGLDSLALVELGIVAEREFGVSIADDEITPDDTVADLAKLIASKAT